VNRIFWDTLVVVESVTNTLNLDEVDTDNYEAIFLAGGHGTMWDFAQSRSVAERVAQIYQQGGIVGAVCHGPTALLNVKLSGGRHLLDGKRVTGFTNDEEAAVKLTEIVPFLLESEMQSKGAIFVAAENFKPNVVVDQRLVTGQNPAFLQLLPLRQSFNCCRSSLWAYLGLQGRPANTKTVASNLNSFHYLRFAASAVHAGSHVSGDSIHVMFAKWRRAQKKAATFR